MNTLVSFSNDCKFAFLGLTNARVDIPSAGITLADGTEVLTKPPIDLDSEWQSWLGIQASQVSAADLVLARRAVDGFPPASLPISDDTSWNLAKQVENVFSMLRLLGTIEYESAFLIMGYLQNGQAVCQHFSKFGRYEITRGCLPWLIRKEHLATAASLAQTKASLLASYPDAQSVRLFRGWWALTSALQQFYASDQSTDL